MQYFKSKQPFIRFSKDIALLLIFYCFVCFSINCWNWIESKLLFSDKAIFDCVTKINATPNLPNSFYERYKKIYPNHITTTPLSVSIDQALFFKIYDFFDYPICFEKQIFPFLCHSVYKPYTINDSINSLSTLFSWRIQSEVDPKKCFDFYYNNFKIAPNENPLLQKRFYRVRGITAFSYLMFMKPIEDLNDDEFIELILFVNKRTSTIKLRDKNKFQFYVDELKRKLNS